MQIDFYFLKQLLLLNSYPTTKFGLRKLETSFYRMIAGTFRYLEPLRRGSKKTYGGEGAYYNFCGFTTV